MTIIILIAFCPLASYFLILQLLYGLNKSFVRCYRLRGFINYREFFYINVDSVLKLRQFLFLKNIFSSKFFIRNVLWIIYGYFYLTDHPLFPNGYKRFIDSNGTYKMTCVYLSICPSMYVYVRACIYVFMCVRALTREFCQW